MLAEFLRHRDGEPGAGAGAEAQNQEIQRACRAYARQCVNAQKAAYDHRVHSVVHLLKQQAEQQRNEETEKQPGR